MNNLIDLTFEKTVKCTSNVAKWNYWDHDHLDNVHDGYRKSDILYEKDNVMFRIDQIKIPLIPFLKIKTPVLMIQHDKDTLLVYSIQFGIESKTTIKIEEIKINETKITMNYKFYLPGIKILLKPILKKLIPKWNEKVWTEDLPLKLRRQKILGYNFKDFQGLPEKISDRFNKETFQVKLPIKRTKNSLRDRHPLRHKD